MKILRYKYNPDKKGVFRVSVVKNPAVGEGDLVLMNADLENGDAPITTYADMLVKNPEGKFLIIKRNDECEFEPGKWGFPGGKVIPGETTRNGAIRECSEECGIDIDSDSVVDSGEVVNKDKTTSHYFTGTPTSELKLGDEHQDYAWVGIDDLDDYELILDNTDRFKRLLGGEVVEMSEQPIKGIFYAPVMIPDLKIQRIDPKTQEKYQVYYDADTIEQLSTNYFKKCGNRSTNLEHENEDTEGVYPVESWIVADPENDKSKALGMPLQKQGTWIMGYKADNPEVLQKIKDNLLQGLSIEGFLDAEEELSINFNKHEMEKTILEKMGELLGLIKMSSDEAPPAGKTEEELAAEKKAEMEASDAEAAKKKAEEEAAAGGGGEDPAKELETAKATIEEQNKKIADLEAKLAAYENDATLMSAQISEIEKQFTAYKAVKMSSPKLGDEPAEKVVLTAAEVKHAQFLKDVQSKL